MSHHPLQRLYDQIPAIKCKGLCHESCGPIPMSQAEWARLRKLHGPIKLNGSSCGILGSDNRCTQYQNRPMVCRLFGVAQGMPCPFGCKPSRALSGHDARRLLDEARRIGGKTRSDLVALYVNGMPQKMTM